MMLKYRGGLPRGRLGEPVVVRVKGDRLTLRSSWWGLVTLHHWSYALPLAAIGPSRIVDARRGVGRYLLLGLYAFFTHPQVLELSCQLADGVETVLVLGGSKRQLAKLDQQLLQRRLRLAGAR